MIYAAIFFLSDYPQIYKSEDDKIRDLQNGLELDEVSKFIICVVIIILNTAFLICWIWHCYHEATLLLKTSFSKLYIRIFLKGNSLLFEKELEKR